MVTRVLVVGQTPPPYHGQSLMIEKLLAGRFPGVQLFHVRMAFSREIGEIGRFRFGKILHLVSVVCKIWIARIRHSAAVLYYPPAGHKRLPVYRDILILLLTRWMFKRTVFHFHAGGMTEIRDQLSSLGRGLFDLAFSAPDIAIRVSALAPPDGFRLGALHNVVVPNGLEDVFPAYSERRGLAHSRPRVLFVGSVSESKGIRVLLDAVKILAEQDTSFDVEIVGAFSSSQFETGVRRQVKSAGLESRVSFSGLKTGAAKWDAFLRADVFCFPSYYEAEALPLVVLEALQFDLPVVSTRWRGIPSVVIEGETGFLVTPQNSVQLAERLGVLLSDPELRQAMGQRGRELFLREFTIEKWYARMAEVLSSVFSTEDIQPVNKPGEP